MNLFNAPHSTHPNLSPQAFSYPIQPKKSVSSKKNDNHVFNNEIYSYILQNANISIPNTNQKNSSKKKITRMKFTPQEDNELLELVSKYGDQNWKIISEEMSKKNNCSQSQNGQVVRTPRQCKDRYTNYLSPDINKEDWTVEEDQCLILNLSFRRFQWSTLKKFFPGRSEVALRNRFNYIHRTFMRHIKPRIANSISQMPLSQKNGLVEISKSNEAIQEGSDQKMISTISPDQNQFLKQFNLANPSYWDSFQSHILNFYNENIHPLNSNNKFSVLPVQNKNDNSNLSTSPNSILKMPFNNALCSNVSNNDFNQDSNNIINLSNINRINLNNQRKDLKMIVKKNITIPQQWIEAANTIITATQTEEVKMSISEIQKKAESLYGILKNRAFLAQQEKMADLFNINSENEQYDDITMFEMI